ncbi:MAG: ATP-grasp domain-containing protein [Chloroflexi bacterium]|nr:ATP-grasp domain-containing protein [Chloroflexota bacterium]
MKRVLVTGAGGSAAANFVDSLRLSPEPFYIVGTDVKPFHLELSAVDQRFLLPPTSAPDYLDKLNELIAREQVEFVHAQPDVEVAILSENRERVNARLFLPAAATIRLCHDKMATVDLLKRAGVPVPESYPLRSEADLRQAVDVLLCRHEKAWLRAVRGAGSRASLPIKRLEHGLAWIDYWYTMHEIGFGDFMISEFLPGQEFAFQSLWSDGQLVTSQARVRLQYIFGHLTPSGQTSSPSVARTVHRDDVNDIARLAVAAIDPHASGVFCVDLKENRSGVPCVTEINVGRFFTTSNFFAHAGTNMPYIYVKMAYGEPLPDVPKVNPVPAGWYWVRMVDMGYKLVREEQWSSRQV